MKFEKGKAKLVLVIGALNILVSGLILLLASFNLVRFIVILSRDSSQMGRFDASVLTSLLFFCFLLIPFCLFWIFVGAGLVKYENWARLAAIWGTLCLIPLFVGGSFYKYIAGACLLILVLPVLFHPAQSEGAV